MTFHFLLILQLCNGAQIVPQWGSCCTVCGNDGRTLGDVACRSMTISVMRYGWCKWMAWICSFFMSVQVMWGDIRWVWCSWYVVNVFFRMSFPTIWEDMRWVWCSWYVAKIFSFAYSSTLYGEVISWVWCTRYVANILFLIKTTGTVHWVYICQIDIFLSELLIGLNHLHVFYSQTYTYSNSDMQKWSTKYQMNIYY